MQLGDRVREIVGALDPNFFEFVILALSSKMRSPSGFWGISNVSKSDLAFTFAASRSSTITESRSSVAWAPSFSLMRKNSMVKIIPGFPCIMPNIAWGNWGRASGC
jgi:hypothetical protein